MKATWALCVLLACAHPQAGGGAAQTLLPREELALGERKLNGLERVGLVTKGVTLSASTARSFHVGYMGLFHAHQPVFITADSTLYAWHSSYDAMLMHLEYEALIPTLTALLAELMGAVSSAKDADPQARDDLVLYLTVAQRLLADSKGGPPAADAIVAAVTGAGPPSELKLFGAEVLVDLSMFKPRGHYTKSPQLSAYFRAMSWLGRIELTLAKKGRQGWSVDRRALKAAELLAQVSNAGILQKWHTIDDALAELVGPPDSMSLPGLTEGLRRLGPLSKASDASIVAAFEPLSQQRIQTQLVGPGATSIALVLLGSRFVFDSEVFTHLTYGALESKPMRMMPSPLDVGHVLFHNPQAFKLLARELETYGKPYAVALDAERTRSDLDPALWEGSVYHQWLAALRHLSYDPARDAALPAPFSSDAWGLRLLNTQLASWAELRHDNLLYAKQSATAMALCEFPDAYVDPYPEFFGAMERIAERGLELVERLPMGAKEREHVAGWLEKMRGIHGRLRHIAERERLNQPLEGKDLDWINQMVSLGLRGQGCTTITVPEGWYPELFLEQGDVLYQQPIVADVHTQPTDEAGNMVGRVLHVGTRAPRMMAVTVKHDGGEHTQTYRGFVSHYGETITSGFARLTDADWAESRDEAPEWLKPIIADGDELPRVPDEPPALRDRSP